LLNDKSYFDFFKNTLRNNSDKIALIYRDKSYSYNQLEEMLTFWEKNLSEKKVLPGDVVILIGDFDPMSVSGFFSLIGLNIIIVPLLRTHTEDYVNEVKEITHADHCFSISSDLELSYTKLDGGEKHDLFKNIKSKNNPGLVLLSSGSTGKPKAAVHDFSKLLSRFFIKEHHHCMINFLMFDHWGGLNTLLHILSGAGTVITTENRSPENICALVEKYKVETLPVSPSFLNLLLLSRSYEGKDLSSLKLITYGSEPMPLSTLENARRVFPNAVFKQTYGLIELGVFKTKSKSSDSLFLKIDPRDCLTRIHDGKLELKTETAMLGYLNAESPFTEDGWFKTGDLVEVEGDYIRILGRDSEMINVGGEKVFPIEVENVIMQFPNVEDVIVYKEPHPLIGNMVCAQVKLIEKCDEKSFLLELKKYCSTQLARYKVPAKIKISNEKFSNSRQKKSRLNR
jgi:long-chain acyl-CoA synthetase